MQKTVIATVLLLMLMGCTIMQMQKENREAEAQIAQKEARLSELESERERLEQHRALLAERLDRTALTSRQLNEELDHLIRKNRQLAAMAEQQGQDIDAIKQEIEALEEKQSVLSRMTVSGDAEAVKEQKILALQQEIRNYLLLGLKSKHRKSLQ